MSKHFCICFSLKAGAIIMSFLNLLEGATETIVAITELSGVHVPVDYLEKKFNETHIGKNPFPTDVPGIEGNITFYFACLLVGLLSIFNGLVLLIGLLQAKEKFVLLYVLLGSVGLFIVIIYTGIYMFKYAVLSLVFLLSIFMCYGQLSMYYFYEEVTEYNTVKSGVIEIAYNGDVKSYENSGVPGEKDVDNTAV